MNFLIIGLGSIGKRHLKILRSLGAERITAMRSGKSEKSESKLADREVFSIAEAYSEKPDAVLITNPTSLHISSAIEYAQMGIPLFIEKPLGKDLGNADKLEAVVKKNNVRVLIGYNFVYHPAIIKIKQLCENGVIGKVISARAQFGTFMPEWHKNEDYKKSYASNSSMGGGVVLTSIHEQNYLTGMFGQVINIKAMEVGGNNIGIDAEEGVEVILKHSTGVVSSIHLNFFQKPYYRNLQIIGTDGTLYWEYTKPEIKILTKEKTETIKLGGTPQELLDISYHDQMKHFIDVVRGKAEPRIPLKQGIEDMTTALKILKDIGRN